MSYIVVENYNGGMDRRRIRIDQQANSLYNLVNAHINRGGQIESRKAFVPTYDLTAGLTFGLGEKQGTLYTFGSADPLTVGLPAGVSYQRCQHPDGSTAMTAVIDVDIFNGLLYVIAQFSDSPGKCRNLPPSFLKIVCRKKPSPPNIGFVILWVDTHNC